MTADRTSFPDNRQHIDFHDAVARELDRHLRNRSSIHDDDPVIATDEGTFFSKDGLAKVFQRIRIRSGILRFSAHILRHTWATDLELKREGGWSTWDQVERYSHAVPVRDRSQLPNPLARRATQKLATVVTLRPTGTLG